MSSSNFLMVKVTGEREETCSSAYKIVGQATRTLQSTKGKDDGPFPFPVHRSARFPRCVFLFICLFVCFLLFRLVFCRFPPLRSLVPGYFILYLNFWRTNIRHVDDHRVYITGINLFSPLRSFT